jgi:hypothetical protein
MALLVPLSGCAAQPHGITSSGASAGSSVGAGATGAHAEERTEPVTRIGLIADPQWAATPAPTAPRGLTLAQAQGYLAAWSPHAIGVLGDITDDFGQTESQMRESIRAVIDALTIPGIPIAVLPGNHDCPVFSSFANLRSAWPPAARAFFQPEVMYGSFVANGVQLVMLDAEYQLDGNWACVRGAPHKYGPITPNGLNGAAAQHGYRCVPPEQIEWLDRVLAASRFPVMVLSHEAIAYQDGARGPGANASTGRMFEGVGLVASNAGAVKAVLKRHAKKIVGCFNGHAHISGHHVEDGIHYVALNALHDRCCDTGWFGEYSGAFLTKVTVDARTRSVTLEKVEFPTEYSALSEARVAPDPALASWHFGE